MQAVRAGLVKNWREYPHNYVKIEVERAVERAVELNALLEGVLYACYERRKRRGQQS